VRIAYLVSQYPATSHTFIRREVTALRATGVEVATFSVRAPCTAELQSEIDRREAASTFTILSRSPLEFLSAHLTEFFGRPGRYLRSLSLALRHRPPGAKGLFLALAHFVEAMLLARELRRRTIAHLHTHFANSGAAVGLLASRQAGIGWSFTIHGISEFDYPGGLTLPDKVAAAEFVACVSYFGRAQAARITPPDQWPKLTIVRCGLELDRLPPKPDRDNAGLRFVFVGRLSPEKGIEGLLEALASVRADLRPRLVLVGDGPLRATLERRIGDLGLRDQVDLLGRLAEAETLKEIAASDALVLPSFMEGLPIVLMEALSLGVPVIASRVAGIPELVADGETGLLFTPSNWSELAEAIERLATDPGLRQRLGQAGPARIAGEFDVRTSALKLRDLFLRDGRFAASPAALPSERGPNTLAPSTGHKAAD